MRIFEGKREANDSVLARVRSLLSNLRLAECKLKGINLNGKVICDSSASWNPPRHGWIKVNVDGAFAMNLGLGCGGLMRNSNGKFIEGFMFHPTEGDSFTAELWALILGLKLAWEKGERRIIVESDALELIQLLEQGNTSQHADAELIQEAKSLIGRQWEIELLHIPRGANSVADFLAKRAITTVRGYELILESPDYLFSLLQKDCCLFSSTG